MSFTEAQKPPRRLIVHVGDHKAGSSSIQAALARGDVALASGTLGYPLLGKRWNHNHLRATLPSARPGAGSGAAPGGQGPGLAELANAARNINADVTVLSAEELERVSPAALREALDREFSPTPGTLDVITYLRPHYARVISSLAEQIKLGWARKNPAEHLTKHLKAFTLSRVIYAPRLTAWREAFGEAFKVRPMIRAELEKGNLVEDLFATTLGVGQIVLRHGTKANESLSVEDLMRLNVVHTTLPGLGRWHHHKIGWALAQVFNHRSGRAKSVTRLTGHRKAAEALRVLVLDDARKVDSEWFGGRKLFERELDAAVDTAPRAAQSLRPEDWLAADEIRSLRAFSQVLGAIAGSDQPWRPALSQLIIDLMAE